MVCGHIAGALCLGYSEAAMYQTSEEQNLKLQKWGQGQGHG